MLYKLYRMENSKTVSWSEKIGSLNLKIAVLEMRLDINRDENTKLYSEREKMEKELKLLLKQAISEENTKICSERESMNLLMKQAISG